MRRPVLSRNPSDFIWILSLLGASVAASGCGLQIQALKKSAQSQICDASATPFGGGTGSAEDPYLICAAAQFAAIAGAMDAAYLITDDLDLSGASGFPIGIDDADVFRGTLDGGSHVLSDLTLTDTTTAYGVGIFRKLDGGTVKNLTLRRFQLSGHNFTGAIAGRASAGTIDHVSISDLSVTGRAYVGGLVGLAEWEIGGVARVDLTLSNISGDGITIVDSFDGTQMRRFLPAVDSDTGAGGLLGSQDKIDPNPGTLVLLHFENIALRNVAVSTTTNFATLTAADYTYGGVVTGMVADLTAKNVRVSDSSVSMVGPAGGVFGYKDYGATQSLAEDISAIRVSVTGTPSPRTGRVGGIASSANGIDFYRTAFVGSIAAANGSVGGLAGGGCGVNGYGVYVDATIAQTGGGHPVAGYIGGDCVSVHTDVFVSGTLNVDATTVGSVIGSGWSTRDFHNALSVAAMTNAPAGIASTRPAFASAPAGTVAGLYHLDVLDAGLTADPYSVSRSAAQIASAATFPEFDFAATWVMATAIPDYAGAAPVPRFACGLVPGLVCP